MKRIAIATAFLVVAVGCKAKDRNADTSAAMTDTMGGAGVTTDTAHGAMAPGGTGGTTGGAAGTAGSGGSYGGTSGARTGSTAGTSGTGTGGTASGTSGSAQNQTQSGVTNTRSGTSTLGPNVKKATPTSGQPVTAKGDTLQKKRPR